MPESGTALQLMLGLVASHPGRLFVVTIVPYATRPMSCRPPLCVNGLPNLGTPGGSLARWQFKNLQPILPLSDCLSPGQSPAFFSGADGGGTNTVTEPALSHHSETDATGV